MAGFGEVQGQQAQGNSAGGKSERTIIQNLDRVNRKITCCCYLQVNLKGYRPLMFDAHGTSAASAGIIGRQDAQLPALR